MTAHVSHLIAEYVDGQLSPRLKARVIRHTAECARCRAALARHEQVRGDLDRTLGGYLSPGSTLNAQWWQAIQAMPVRVHRWRMSIAFPLLMALVLLVMPVIGAQRLSLFTMPGLEATYLQPQVDITLNPPTSGGTLQDTRVLAESTPASRPAARQLDTHPTLARVEVPLIATPPSD